MRRITIAAAVALLAVLTPSAASAYTSTGTGYPLIAIDNGAGAQQNPRISGGRTAYTDDQGGISSHIEYFDFSTNATTSIPTPSNTIDFLADVGPGGIVSLGCRAVVGPSTCSLSTWASRSRCRR